MCLPSALAAGVCVLTLLASGGTDARAQSAPYAYIPNNGSNNVTVIDTATNAQVGVPFAVGSGPLNVAVSGDQSFAYVTNFNANTVMRIDTATNTVTATIPTGTQPYGAQLSPDGRLLFVSNSGSSSVSVIDTSTNTVVATIGTAAGSRGMAITPDRQTVYVANSTGIVSAINVASNAVVATIPTGVFPIDVVMSPDGTTAWAVNQISNTVTPINTATNTAGPSIPVGSQPVAIAISPDGTRLYVANNVSDNISVINVATGMVIATITVGDTPRGVEVSPDGRFAYVANRTSNTISVIDTATNTVVATIPVGTNPSLPGVCSNGNALLASGLTFRANTSGALGCTLSSGPTGATGPVFTGGTLQFIANNIISALPVTLAAAGGTIDTNGNNATLNGAISGAGGLSKTGAGTLVLGGPGTYSGATGVSAGTLQAGAANVFSPNSAYTIASGATLALANFSQTIASLAGAGSVTLGSATLTTGGNDASTMFAGVISGTGSLVKNGSGTLTLSGANTYSGSTTVNGGALAVNGSLAGAVIINSALLGGTGTVGSTTIGSGALSPGNSIGTFTVQGNLVLTSAASYLVEIDPTTSDRTNVTGTATLGGAAVSAIYAAGSYVSKQYTILNATGGVTGTFNTLVQTNLPANFTASLSYDANNAYLNLTLNFIPTPTPAPPANPPVFTGLTVNQSNVANALINSFNTAGGIPTVFATLTPPGLTQISGEAATGTQQTTLDAMDKFVNLLTDPFMSTRHGAQLPGAPGYADEDEALAFAGRGKARNAAERDAYAKMVVKARPQALPFERRWSVWGAGYGGQQTTDGDAAEGSAATRARIAGAAAGFDYRLDPNTLIGFSLGGAGANYSLANGLGGGRSEIFQAGVYGRHSAGPAYLAAALAYGWQTVTTDRVALLNSYRANFDTNALSGRFEGGYRFGFAASALTPYAAGQFTAFRLPAYAEQVVTGVNTFALDYADKDVTASRAELGLRADTTFAMSDAIVTLRGRAAWAHNFNTGRSVNAIFQTLPASAFTVNGAAQARDSALVSASAETRWPNGFSVAATFEGEFSGVTESYAGKGMLRYHW